MTTATPWNAELEGRSGTADRELWELIEEQPYPPLTAFGQSGLPTAEARRLSMLPIQIRDSSG
jgi:hypothetical protein